jgi:hypothetical protein
MVAYWMQLDPHRAQRHIRHAPRSLGSSPLLASLRPGALAEDLKANPALNGRLANGCE